MGFSAGRSRALPGETQSAEPEGSHPFLGSTTSSASTASGMQETSPLVQEPSSTMAGTSQSLLLFFFFVFNHIPCLFYGQTVNCQHQL